MANGLRGLAYDISAAHRLREAELAGIRKEKDEIFRQTDEMLEEFRRMRSERRSEIFRMKKEIAGMLSGFRKEISMLRRERERDAAAWRDIIVKMHTKGKKETGQGRGKKGEKPEKSE